MQCQPNAAEQKVEQVLTESPFLARPQLGARRDGVTIFSRSKRGSAKISRPQIAIMMIGNVTIV